LIGGAGQTPCQLLAVIRREVALNALEHAVKVGQETDLLIAPAHGHRSFAQTGLTGDGLRPADGGFGQLFLYLQASGASGTGLGKQLTKRVFEILAMMGHLPGVHRTQGERQPGGRAEGTFVFPVDF